MTRNLAATFGLLAFTATSLTAMPALADGAWSRSGGGSGPYGRTWNSSGSGQLLQLQPAGHRPQRQRVVALRLGQLLGRLVQPLGDRHRSIGSHGQPQRQLAPLLIPASLSAEPRHHGGEGRHP